MSSYLTLTLETIYVVKISKLLYLSNMFLKSILIILKSILVMLKKVSYKFFDNGTIKTTYFKMNKTFKVNVLNKIKIQ